MPKPSLHSPSLKSAIEAVGEKIDQYTVTLDQISDDIRALEKWLQESGVRIEVEVALSLTFSPETLPTDVAVQVSRSEEMLAWGPTGDCKTWRILYRNYLQEGTHISGQMWHPAWLENNLVEQRPLIEAPVPIRLKAAAAGALGKLVKQITAQIPQYDADISVEGELRLVEYYDAPPPDGIPDGFGLMFVPIGGNADDRPCKTYSTHESSQLVADLQSLTSPEVNEKIASDWMYTGFELRCTLSFRALRRLGLIG